MLRLIKRYVTAEIYLSFTYIQK